MKTINLAPALLACSALSLFLAGCASEPESHVVSAPPPPAPNAAPMVTATVAQPMTVTTQTTMPGGQVQTQTQNQPVIVVTQAPPANQAEVVLARPSSQHLWVPGYWTWRNNRYEWMAGHWEVPPSSNAKWTPPRWETENGAYRFYEGYWAS